VADEPLLQALVIFEVSAPDGSTGAIGAQRIALSDGASAWQPDRFTVVSSSAYHEGAPAAVTDGKGGAIAVFEARTPQGPLAGDYDLLVQRIGADGILAWNEAKASTPLANSAQHERKPVLLADGQGGAFVVFERTPPSGAPQLSAQRIDQQGELRWAGGQAIGVPLYAHLAGSAPAVTQGDACLASDGAGGLLVAFHAYENGHGLLMAQRFDAWGNPVWSQPKPMAATLGAEASPCLLPDGSGGAILLHVAHVQDGEHAGDSDIMAQALSPQGVPLWGEADQSLVVAATLLAERTPMAISDGAGGAIVVFEAEWRSGPRKGECDVLAQRIDRQGKGLWNDGIPIAVASSDWSERRPQLVSDGAGGAIVVFEQYPPREHLSDDVDLGAQRISAQGELSWQQGQRSVSLSASTHAERNPSPVADGAGGVLVFFEALTRSGEHAGDVEIAAQRLDASGQTAWERPVPVAYGPLQEERPVAVGR